MRRDGGRAGRSVAQSSGLFKERDQESKRDLRLKTKSQRVAGGDRPGDGAVTLTGPWSLALLREGPRGSERCCQEQEVEPASWEKSWLCLARPSPQGSLCLRGGDWGVSPGGGSGRWAPPPCVK